MRFVSSDEKPEGGLQAASNFWERYRRELIPLDAGGCSPERCSGLQCVACVNEEGLRLGLLTAGLPCSVRRNERLSTTLA